jgi:hypothetical protein
MLVPARHTGHADEVTTGRSVLMGLTFAGLVVACSSSGAPATARRVASLPASPSSCASGQRNPKALGGLTEIKGSGSESLFGLVFAPYPLRGTSDTVKIVWRMTGSGPLSLWAVGPTGDRVAPEWGPEPHDGSSWNRPGDEWGSGFRFLSQGCWTVHAMRGSKTAQVQVSVLA